METKNINVCETFPDGTPIDGWFYDTNVPSLEKIGKQYVLTAYGILDDGKLYTKEIQALIDLAAKEGGGVIVVPSGTYLTGALFFKQGVHLYVAQGGMLKGSDDCSDYPICETRIEGESCLYFSALINADGALGKHSGFAAAGIQSARIRTNSVRALCICQIVKMCLLQI